MYSNIPQAIFIIEANTMESDQTAYMVMRNDVWIMRLNMYEHQKLEVNYCFVSLCLSTVAIVFI